MVDNTDEEHLDNPTTNQSENSPDEIIPTADSETITQNQETENMEVHHHAHDPAAPHHKKNWKSYFWEFLMLFLAVFCGFLAESYHTHLVNKDIEKRNIESLLSNVKKDSANLIMAIDRCENKIRLTDTLKNIPGDFGDTTFENRFFTYSGQLMMIIDFTPDESAFLQMQSSGTLRLISEQNVVDSILKYHNQNLLIQKHQKSVNDIYFKGLDNFIQIADFRKDTPRFIGNNQQIQSCINYKIAEGGMTELSVIFLKQQLFNATNLITFLEKEYQLNK